MTADDLSIVPHQDFIDRMGAKASKAKQAKDRQGARAPRAVALFELGPFGCLLRMASDCGPLISIAPISTGFDRRQARAP